MRGDTNRSAMSARRLRIRFAKDAREDIRDILVFTEKRWGRQQRAVYRAALDEAFATIRANPQIGRSRDDLLIGVRTFVVREHTVLYTVDEDAITVLRVVHGRIDITGELLR